MNDLAFEIEALNRAVDDFAVVMKEKLARKASEGCRGWNNTEEIVNHATFGTDLLNALGLGDIKNVTYIKVEAFPPGQFPIVTIKCHPTQRAFDMIEHYYEIHERTVDNSVNND